MLVKMWRKENPFALLVEMQTGAATVGNSMEVSQKIKSRTTLQPSNCTTMYLVGYKNADSKGHMHPNVYSTPINNRKFMEIDQMSINWWMEKDVVYTYNGILLGDEKEWNLVICKYFLSFHSLPLVPLNDVLFNHNNPILEWLII